MLKHALGKIVTFVLIAGVIVGSLVGFDVMTKNQVVTTTANGFGAVGFGSGNIVLVGIPSFIGGLGEAADYGRTNANGQDKVPSASDLAKAAAKARQKAADKKAKADKEAAKN